MRGRWILMPGTLCTAADLDPLITVLGVSPACRFEITTRSMSIGDVLAALPNDLKDDDILCCFSIDAIALVNCRPSLPQTRAVILHATNAQTDQPEKSPQRQYLSRMIKCGRIADAIEELWPKSVHATSRSDEALKRKICRMAGMASSDIGAQTRLAISRPGIGRNFKQVKTPILAIADEEDCATPPCEALEVARISAFGNAVIIEGDKHFARLECPTHVAEGIRHSGLIDFTYTQESNNTVEIKHNAAIY